MLTAALVLALVIATINNYLIRAAYRDRDEVARHRAARIVQLKRKIRRLRRIADEAESRRVRERLSTPPADIRVVLPRVG